jgi:hypothetical protein
VQLLLLVVSVQVLQLVVSMQVLPLVVIVQVLLLVVSLQVKEGEKRTAQAIRNHSFWCVGVLCFVLSKM